MEIDYQIDQNIAIISWNMTTSAMNVINDTSLPEFGAALEKAFDDAAVKGIIVTSARPEFIAGADLKMILRNQDQAPKEMLEVSMGLNRLFRRMEINGKPIVAAINGTVLGGGYEVCLACHHRIALDNPKTKIGLPEVKLGLLPGGGGTQRLPRMIGIQAALPLMLEGRAVSPREALEIGMVDEIADSREEMIQAAKDWILANPAPLKPWDEASEKTGSIIAKDNYEVPGGGPQSNAGAQVVAASRAAVLAKTHGNYPAPLAILACVEEGLAVDMDQAIEIEADYFVQVARSKVAGNLIRTMFLGLNKANKGASRPPGIDKTEVKKLGILGAGLMGAGIAYVSALAGIEVVLKDVSPEAAEKGKVYSRKLLDKAISRGNMDEAKAAAILDFIQPTAENADLLGCDLIIEAVFENREVKAQVIGEAEPMLAANGVFGSNTSTLPITGLAALSKNPGNFVGIHFFSPVDKMQLVELIVGEKTSDYALAVAIDYVRKIRKTPIVVNDSRGFYTSRCFISYASEGMELLKDGVDPVLIEEAARQAGMPVGPLAVTDEVALDLVYKIASQSIADGASTESDTSYQVSKKFVELGRMGKKSRAGFYEYPENDTKYPWPGLADIFPLADAQPDIEEVKKRLLYRQALEALRCYEEGVIRTKLDADLGSILAWGFPAYTGGTLSFFDFVGTEEFVKECGRLAEAYGERFVAPASDMLQ
ncbi:3-hydroxyacyl-CoA dehydrogenase NAD-binding domain-containing protein [Persicitalea jodogahamensis]|uniref:3-hydroxyacyl-CoA dehydrogenase n=1 Tax=Persicitalea jodogahamensis TaxID=402147 RepID=A0A8J3DCM9_9BACT|nr:3-hydroxyacyl-CoA dehydrogenase NAD-binding domain-containing protein [Persicitalea jodogahamensis]GHB83412.1 3-hydroxyacyl-CoA dehydrogenase [Persicitalea jodogahamensis]